MSAETYQVGAHFEALMEGVLMEPLKTFESFFLHFEFPFRTVILLPFKTSFNLQLRVKYLTPGVTSIPNQIGQGLAVRSVVLVLVRADGVVVRRKSESPSSST